MNVRMQCSVPRVVRSVRSPMTPSWAVFRSVATYNSQLWLRSESLHVPTVLVIFSQT